MVMRLLIVDDHELVRRGVRSLIAGQATYEVCGEAGDGQDAVEKARSLRPDLIVMDVSMPRLNGLEATRQVRSILPDCEVLIVSQHESSEMAREALNAGARGYVVKSSLSRDLITAINKVSQREYFFDPAILDKTPSTHTDVREILQRSAAFEKALRESEELYRTTFESVAVGVAHVSPEGKWLRVNNKLCEIVGYSEAELLKLTFQDITHPDDLAADLAQAEKLRDGGLKTYSLEKRYVKKDGSIVWINLTVSGVRDSDGNLDHFISVVEDIGAKKRAQDALRESEERLRLAHHVAHLGTFECDMKKGVNYWSPELEKMYGLPPGGFAGNQRAFEELVHPDDVAKVRQLVEQAVNDGESEGEWRIVWPDGSIHWIFGRRSVFKDKDGIAERMIGVNIDTTERKKAHEALRESQTQLALALESSRTAMFDWDIVESQGQWNPQMAALYDFNPAGRYITSEEWRSLFHPEDKERLAEEARRIWQSQDEEFTFEFRSVRRDGEIHWMLSHGRIVRGTDGKALRMIGTHSDITERKLQEAERHRTEQHFRAFFESSAIGAVRADLPDTRFLDVNDTFCRMTGYSREELQNLTAYDITHPEDQETTSRAVRRLRTKGVSTFTADKRYVRKDGSSFWARIAVNLVPERDGEPAHDVAVIIDINDRKLLETQLEAEVRARTRELETKNADLSRQSEQVRELSQRLLQAQDEERRRIARELHDSAGQTLAVLGMKLTQFIDEAGIVLPQLAKLGADIEKLAAQLNSEIRTTSYLLHPPLLDETGLPSALKWYVQGLASRSEIAVTLEIAEDFGRLPNDMELAVFRLVQECLTNIHRHSGSKTALIRLVRNRENVQIEVRDQGKGISVGHLAEIQSGASGVGIRGMQERLRHFRGEMKIESDGSGTCVTVTIPVPADAPNDLRSPQGDSLQTTW
jgi:PAS domain S-box-containing protein